MDINREWKHWLVDIGLSSAEVARRVGQTPPNLQQKINNETIKATELDAILNQFGYELRIMKKEG